MERDFIDLYELQRMTRETLQEGFPDRLWVRAEISSLQVKANGHCYLDLVQRGDAGAVAKAKAVIWRSKYALLQGTFREETGSDLQTGMSVLLWVQVTFSELYGLTLTVDDIDAEVTLGAQEKLRRETLARLAEEGLLDKQQELTLPVLPYALAVISARDAAGYGDFCHHLQDNPYGFVFRLDFFEATMQGAAAPQSIVDALDAVQTAPVAYDAVLILRGGGSNFDLSCFDDYGLCFSIAHHPIPVFTAIGHDRDHHIADDVAFLAVKTPTALADEFLDCFMAEDERIEAAVSRLKLAFLSKIGEMESRVELLRTRIRAADPRQILERGYTLVTDSRGVVLKHAQDAQVGDRLSILFRDGTLVTEVKSK